MRTQTKAWSSDSINDSVSNNIYNSIDDSVDDSVSDSEMYVGPAGPRR